MDFNNMFDVMENVPCIPLDTWINVATEPIRHPIDKLYIHLFNHPRIYYSTEQIATILAERNTFDGNRGFLMWNDYHSLAHSCHYHCDGAGFDEQGRPTLDREVEFLTKLYIVPHEDGVNWLHADISFVKDDAPKAFRNVTKQRMKDADFSECILVPVGYGKIAIEEFEEMETEQYGKEKQYGVKFIDYGMISMVSLYRGGRSEPFRLSYVWKYYDPKDPPKSGSGMNEEVRGNAFNRGLNKLYDRKQKEDEEAHKKYLEWRRLNPEEARRQDEEYYGSQF